MSWVRVPPEQLFSFSMEKVVVLPCFDICRSKSFHVYMYIHIIYIVYNMIYNYTFTTTHIYHIALFPWGVHVHYFTLTYESQKFPPILCNSYNFIYTYYPVCTCAARG